MTTLEHEQARQRTLLARLAQQWRAQGLQPQCYETHISWVWVVGALAYKFKKAVQFDVLDYSTLALRAACCAQELLLNHAFAPALYLEVVTVGGSAEHPLIGGGGPVLEYAVCMRAFAQQTLWSARLLAGTLSRHEVDALAVKLAQLHRTAPAAPLDMDWGTPGQIHATGQQDLQTLLSLLDGWASPQVARTQAAMLLRWHAEQAPPAAMLTRRRVERRIRACHGDLHAANLLTLDGQVELFDCIEFNPALRWIDVLNDLAFSVMDLRWYGRPELAAHLLGRYLEASGDYGGMAVLRYYQTLRAVARCKVGLLRAQEAPAAEAALLRHTALRYLGLAALDLTRRGAVLLMHGFSGCGKSVAAAALADAVGGVRLRSDVERKRLHGLAPSEHVPSAAQQGIYAAQATRATYARLLRLASATAAAGWPAVVDATFLQRRHRQQFAALATRLGLPFYIVDVQTPGPVLLARLAQRHQHPDDASDAGEPVLAYQLMNSEPLSVDELTHTVVLDGAAVTADEIAAVARGMGFP